MSRVFSLHRCHVLGLSTWGKSLFILPRDGFYTTNNKIPTLLINVTCSIPIFRYEAESDKMWIPEDSKYISNKAWIDENFVGTGQRGQYLLFRSEKNVLTPDALQNVSRFRIRWQDYGIDLNQLKISQVAW